MDANQTQLAQALGLTDRRVRQLKDDEVIVRLPNDQLITALV